MTSVNREWTLHFSLLSCLTKTKKIMELSSDQVEKFHRDGYLIIENFMSPAECDRLRQRAYQIIAEEDLSAHPLVTFNTTDMKQVRTDYFITSGDKIRFFFEDGAVGENGKLKVSPEKAMNKMGHALHVLDPDFKAATQSDKVRGVARSLGLKKPLIVQSMVIFKQPHFGGTVSPHQDSTFLFTTPMNVLGFWIALEDADTENACLWFAPDSHKSGISSRFVRTTAADGTVSTILKGSNPNLEEEKFVATPVRKGTLVLIHGEVVHKSEENSSDRSRNIYTFHLYDAGTSVWSEENWLQPTEQVPFPSLY